MAEELELPDGITLNSVKEEPIELDKVTEAVYSMRCKVCSIYFEGSLLTNFGRHEGVIKVMPSEVLAWKNPLPKDRNKSIKMLIDNLSTKLDKHIERDHND